MPSTCSSDRALYAALACTDTHEKCLHLRQTKLTMPIKSSTSAFWAQRTTRPTRNSSKFTSCSPSADSTRKMNHSNKSQARNRLKLPSIPNYPNQQVPLKQQRKPSLKELMFTAPGYLPGWYAETWRWRKVFNNTTLFYKAFLEGLFSSKVTLSTFVKKEL